MKNGMQIAAFKCPHLRYRTVIIKKSKAGHYFWNDYIEGGKFYNRYHRISSKVACQFTGLSKQTLDRKLKYSTERIEKLVQKRKAQLV